MTWVLPSQWFLWDPMKDRLPLINPKKPLVAWASFYPWPELQTKILTILATLIRLKIQISRKIRQIFKKKNWPHTKNTEIPLDKSLIAIQEDISQNNHQGVH